MRQVRDPNHPRHKLIGSYGTAKSDGSRSSGEKDRRSGGGGGGAGTDLLGGVSTPNNDGSSGHPDVEEEQLYEPSPFFATAATGAAAPQHSRTGSYGGDSSIGEKSSSEQGRAFATNRNSNSTGYGSGIDWNPMAWGSPPSLASEPNNRTPLSGVASSTGDATLGHPTITTATGGATLGHLSDTAARPISSQFAPSAYRSGQVPQQDTASESSYPGAAIPRASSTRKPPLPASPQAPTTPSMAGRRQSDVFLTADDGLQDTGRGRDTQGRPTRFVLHEDAGTLDDDSTQAHEDQM
jgi:hypothetical protein